jgi:hypothetical protein
LIPRFLNDAWQLLQGRLVPQIIDSIIETFCGELDSAFLGIWREKVSRYIEILASTGETDPHQLAAYGRAYLEELRNPDTRYTGC